MLRLLLFLLFFVMGAVMPAPGDDPLEEDPLIRDASMHYIAERNVTVYRAPNRSTAYLQLNIQDPVWVIGENGGYLQIQTEDGAEGYVDRSAVSNVWIRVSKRTRTVYLYRGTELHESYPADFGYNVFSDKERRGSTSIPDHWRTPEGTFYVAQKNPNSQYHRGFLLNYPTIRHARRGLDNGLITQAEFESIVQANEAVRTPPMNTRLGGHILIHGEGTGNNVNWTQGCVAVKNEHIDAMWELVREGTPVVIES